MLFGNLNLADSDSDTEEDEPEIIKDSVEIIKRIKRKFTYARNFIEINIKSIDKKPKKVKKKVKTD